MLGNSFGHTDVPLADLHGARPYCGDITETDLDALAADATKNDTVKLTQIRPVGYAEALEIFRMANR